MTIDVVLADGSAQRFETLFRIAGQVPLSLDLYYNSALRVRGPWGNARTSSLDVSIEKEANSFVYRDALGRRIFFDPPTPEIGRWVRNAKYPDLGLGLAARGVLLLREGLVTRHFARAEDGVWRLSTIEDANNNVISMDRTSEGRLINLRHPKGLTLAFDYTSEGLRSKIILRGAGGSIKTVSNALYDERGNLVALVPEFGKSSYFDYDRENCAIEWHNGARSRVRLSYDDRQRVVLRQVNDSEPDIYAYTAAGRRTTWYPNGSHEHRQTTEYNSRGLITRKLFADTLVFENKYDDNDHVVERVDALGHSTRLKFDANGNMTALIDPEGRQTGFSIDVAGKLHSLREPDGSRWRFEYDARGNVVAKIDPIGHRTEFVNNANGLPVAIMRADGLIERREYETHLEMSAYRDFRGATTHIERDEFGRVIAITNALGAVTRLIYDDMPGHDFWDPTRVVRADGATVSKSFNRAADTLTIVDGEGRETVRWMGPDDRLEAVRDRTGGLLRFAYDHHGSIVEVRNQKGLAWTFERDAAGRVTREIDFNGLAVDYTHDDAGRLIETRYADGARTVARYDRSGRLKAEELFERGAVEPWRTVYRYDDNGLLAAVSNAHADVAFERDARGSIVAEISNGRRIESRFDCCGNRIERRSGNHVVETSFEPLGLPREIRIGDLASLTFERDKVGREVMRRDGSGMTIAHSWDSAGQLLSQVVQVARAGLPHAALERRMTWNKAWEPVSRSENPGDVISYGLDGNGQVTSVHRGAHSDEHFQYDACGLPIASAAAEGRLESWLSSVGGRVKAARGPRGETILLTYDERGRVVTRRVERDGFRPREWQFGWDGMDQLVSCRTPDGDLWRYGYDGLGRRVFKQRELSAPERAWTRIRFAEAFPLAVNERRESDLVTHRPLGSSEFDPRPPIVGTSFLWDGAVLAEEAPRRLDGSVDWDCATTWHFLPDSFVPLARESAAGVIDHFVTDTVGTPAEMVRGDAGDIVSLPRRGFWGARLDDAALDNERTTLETIGRSPTGDTCPIGFQGQWDDPESGLSYNYRRHYDGMSASYMSPDPIGVWGGLNGSAYVQNPSIFIDPFGLAMPRWGTGKYGVYNKKCHVGDNIEGHELLRNKLLEGLLGIKNRMYGNPAIGLTPTEHDAVHATESQLRAQRGLGPNDFLPPEQDIDLTADALRKNGVPSDKVDEAAKQAKDFYKNKVKPLCDKLNAGPPTS